MPQDKRLIVTKALLYKLQKVCKAADTDPDAPAKEGIYLEFFLPSVVLTQSPELVQGRHFHLPHAVYPKDGRTSCLIIPKVVSHDCFMVNKRHGYYDAVVTAEAICKRHDDDAARRALRVAATFSHFVVDARIAAKLPPVVLDAVRASSSSAAPCPVKALTPLKGLDEKENLAFRLSQGCTAGLVVSNKQGQLLFRVGHGGMTAGTIMENAKHFVVALKRDYPTVWKFINEFKLISNKTDSIRFMEVHIQK